MKLVLSKKVIDQKLIELVSVINQVINITLPGVTCNRQSLIYTVSLNASRDELNVAGWQIDENGSQELNCKEIWEQMGILTISKCLPYFIKNSTSEYRELLSIINTNSQSFISLLDPIVEDYITESIKITSNKPILTMTFPNVLDKMLPKFNLSINDADGLLTPSHNVSDLTLSYETGTDSFSITA